MQSIATQRVNPYFTTLCLSDGKVSSIGWSSIELRKEITNMNQVICPLDKSPCEADCPDRYKDTPEGGCFLTTAQEFGATILGLGGDTVGVLFTPGKEAVQ